VLLDAPCSALGQRPQFKNSVKAKELRSFPKLQKKLFSAAVEALADGGFLVYSTCTFLPQENEAVAAWALETYEQLEIIDLDGAASLGAAGLAGYGLREEHLAKVRRFFGPSLSSRYDADFAADAIGFFICKFRKKKKVAEESSSSSSTPCAIVK